MADKRKVKLLVHGTAFGKPGDIVEVPAQVAEHLCKKRFFHDGYKAGELQVAMYLEDVEAQAKEAEGKAPDLSNMTQAEAEAQGLQNVTKSDPSDVGEVNKRAAAKADEKKAAASKKKKDKDEKSDSDEK